MEVGERYRGNTRTDTPKLKRRSLVSLCLGVLGRHLEDIIEELSEVSEIFPPEIKMALLAIAKRRGLLCDTLLLALVDSSCELLDISGSEVTDRGMLKVIETCLCLKVIDISRCNRLSAQSIGALLQKCESLETLRWGGTPLSNQAARRCLDFLKPKLNEFEEDSWEELDSKDISSSPHTIRWITWFSIDEDSRNYLTVECPQICVNPPTTRYRGVSVPREALPDIVLDALAVEDIDPNSWAVYTAPKLKTLKENTKVESNIIPKSELFRLAFLERDERLAAKRAKNMRQHLRRAEKEFIKYSPGAKAQFLANLAHKSLQR